MMRLVDDFLVLTPSKAAAEAIVRQVTRGVVPVLASRYKFLNNFIGRLAHYLQLFRGYSMDCLLTLPMHRLPVIVTVKLI